MLQNTNPMNMCDDEETLEGWNFVKDYGKHRVSFVKLAMTVQQIICRSYKRKPFADECEEILTYMILNSELFSSMCRKKNHLPPSHYEAFASMFARYILLNEWLLIDKSCPPMRRKKTINRRQPGFSYKTSQRILSQKKDKAPESVAQESVIEPFTDILDLVENDKFWQSRQDKKDLLAQLLLKIEEDR